MPYEKMPLPFVVIIKKNRTNLPNLWLEMCPIAGVIVCRFFFVNRVFLKIKTVSYICQKKFE